MSRFSESPFFHLDLALSQHFFSLTSLEQTCGWQLYSVQSFFHASSLASFEELFVLLSSITFQYFLTSARRRSHSSLVYTILPSLVWRQPRKRPAKSESHCRTVLILEQKEREKRRKETNKPTDRLSTHSKSARSWRVPFGSGAGVRGPLPQMPAKKEQTKEGRI